MQLCFLPQLNSLPSQPRLSHRPLLTAIQSSPPPVSPNPLPSPSSPKQSRTKRTTTPSKRVTSANKQKQQKQHISTSTRTTTTTLPTSKQKHSKKNNNNISTSNNDNTNNYLYFLPNQTYPHRHLDPFYNYHNPPPSNPPKRRRSSSLPPSSSSVSSSSRQPLSPEDAIHMATISNARRLNCISIFSTANKRRRTTKNKTIISPSTTPTSTSTNLSKAKRNDSISTKNNAMINPLEKEVINARNQLTIKWLWLVSAIARKLYYSYSQSFPEMKSALSLSDLVQEGVCGLILAVEKWDASKGYPFDSFAFYTIKNSVIRAVQNQSRPIRLPIHVLEKLSKMRKISEYLKLHNKPINVDTIAKYVGISKSSVELYLQRNHSTVSIDEPIQTNKPSSSTPSLFSSHRTSSNDNKSNNNSTGNNSNKNNKSSLREFLIDHTIDVARYVERSCTKEAVYQLVNSTDLLDLERNVLFLKFGLDDGIERVRAEVSRILDVRVHNVRRAELSALKKLRESIGDDTSWIELIAEYY